MGTGWSQEEEEEISQAQSQPHNEPTNIQNHHKSQHPYQSHTQETKFNRTNSKEVRADETSTHQGNGKPVARVASVEVKPLPHNFDAILRQADSPIGRSCVDKLDDQLYQGVFLNQKRQKYWVERRTNSNCFMLFARDLLITWADNRYYWQYSPCVSQYSSGETVDVAELLNVCWVEVHGRFDTAKLTPGTQYEAVFVVMLKDPAYGWETPVNLRLTLPNGAQQEHKENLMMRPRMQWLEIPVGEFQASEGNSNGGEIEISLYEYEGGKWKRGLVVMGIIIRPKI